MNEKQQPKPPTIRHNEKVIAVVMKTGDGMGRYEVRLVSWNGRPPVLEKRQVIGHHENGDEWFGKNKGLTLKEVRFIVDNGPSIIREMEAGKRACQG